MKKKRKEKENIFNMKKNKEISLKEPIKKTIKVGVGLVSLGVLASLAKKI